MIRIGRPGAFLAAFVLLLGVCLALPPVRQTLLRAAGRALVKEDPVHSADVIVLTESSGVAGALEASELIRAGVSKRVVVFKHDATRAERELAARGVRFADPLSVALQQLSDLGVPAVEQVPWPVGGTTEEEGVLPRWCRQHDIHSFVFVTTYDHTRRARRGMNRAFQDLHTTVIVRGARYSDFDPDTWWLSRGGTRTEITELEKLLFDILKHPLS